MLIILTSMLRDIAAYVEEFFRISRCNLPHCAEVSKSSFLLRAEYQLLFRKASAGSQTAGWYNGAIRIPENT